jgi:hypothetical protein
MQTKMVGVGFLSKSDNQVYDWCILKIPCQVVFNGRTHDAITETDLDHLFDDRETSIRFKGYSRNGRPLYVETNKLRTKPVKRAKTDYYFNIKYN